MDPTDPDNPTILDDPVPGGPTIPEEDPPMGDLPKTGDDNTIPVLVGLMFIALGGIAWLEVNSRRGCRN